MFSHLKRLVVWTTLVALITVSFGSMALAEQTDKEKDLQGGRMIADALLVRPLGIVATLAGGLIFVVSLPFSLLGKNTGEAYERLLADPAAFTFTRPLGDFD